MERNTGRTFNMVQDAIYRAMSPNTRILLVIHEQRFFKYIVNIFESSIDANRFKFNVKSGRHIVFPNGSSILVSCLTTDYCLLGISYDYIFIDHFAYYRIPWTSETTLFDNPNHYKSIQKAKICP